ncbi:DUF4910 domain-containing protein [Ruegeria atlantica]|uniref:DUF4910 domain-containing protein n=1 Tax=Ruegeria atlantica TaxID=81569 RepID=UPI0024944890|nr:DUF4910 domain-containing protein [Ruegeria atlantica]
MADRTNTPVGELLHSQLVRLYPICRSITGPGVRETLSLIGEHIPLSVTEVPSGEPVLDWHVPKEWTIRDAWVADASGNRVIDFQKHNLHIVSYSRPVHTRMSLSELKPHLHSDPSNPEWIPYRTGYYAENWGFCLPHRDLEAMQEGEYEVVVDATLEDGSLTYAECVIPGQTKDEILLSVHICHPSLANDNLSSIVVATELARRLLEGPQPQHTLRVLFIPATIGSITWLARNTATVDRVKHGLVLANLGDPGAFHYKKSRRDDTEINRAVRLVIQDQPDHKMLEFEPYGYDERQFCSPGFDMPMGCFSRTPYASFPEYHTSADNPEFVRPEALEDSLTRLEKVIDILERDKKFMNLNPKGEPMLGRRGLYDAIGGRSDSKEQQMALLWVLNYSDGDHSLLDIAERSQLGFDRVARAAEILLQHGLLVIAS